MNRLYLYTALLLCFGLTAQAQSNFKFEIDQSLRGDTLVLDYFVQKTAGSDFTLGTCNLAAHLNSNNLDVDNAVIDRTVPMMFDAKNDPRSYLRMSKGVRGFINFNIKRYTSGGGQGELVESNRKQIGRILVPITNPCGKNDVNWYTAPLAITDFSGKSVKAQASFINSNGFDLCAKPATPNLVAMGPTTICQGSSVTLRANSDEELIWYKDGVELSAKTDSLVVDEAGVYEAKATLCETCVSKPSTQIQVRMSTTPATPQIIYQTDTLYASNGSRFQWFLNGNPIAGASDGYYALNGQMGGVYTVKTMNDCGEATSQPFAVTSLLASEYGFSINAFPNPFHGSTTLRYNLPEAGRVRVEVTNVLSQEVVEVLNERQGQGEHQLLLTAQEYNWSSGVYMLSLEHKGKKLRLKLVSQK